MKIGFTQNVVRSGDLRVYLALSQPGTPEHDMFLRAIETDNLISIKGGTGLYDYRGDVLQAIEKRLQDGAKKMLAMTVNKQPVYMGSRYARGTCLIAGAAGTLDKEFAEQYRLSGVPVMALGNAVTAIPWADMWVGLADPSAYIPTGIQSPGTTAFVPTQNVSGFLWDTRKKQISRISVQECPNVLQFQLQGYGHDKFQFGCSDLGTGSTLPVAITLAASLGFTDLVFTGVALGGALNNYYCYPDAPHLEIVKAKEKKYVGLRELWSSWFSLLIDNGVRLYTVDDIPGLPMCVLSKEYLFSVRRRALDTIHGKEAVQGVSAPVEKKKQDRDEYMRYKQAILTRDDVFAKADKLAEKMPAVFEKLVAKVKTKVAAARKSKKGCSGCAFNRVVQPLYDVFVSQVQQNREVVDPVWREVFPDKYIVRSGKTEITREDGTQ